MTQMSKEQRYHALVMARRVAGKLPNGPTAGDFHRASLGQNEDILLAIHFILNDHEDGRAHAAAMD